MAMRIESVREKASGTFEVAFSGGLLFSFDITDIKLLDYRFDIGSRTLAVPDEVSIRLIPTESLQEEEIQSLGRLNALHRMRKDALYVVSRAEQGSRQLYEKLIKKGYESELARVCVRWMCDQGSVDDRRYVSLLIRAHMMRKGQGPDRIRLLAWPRIGLFENPKAILSDCFASFEGEDIQEAIRKSADNILKRTKNLTHTGHGIRRHQFQGFQNGGNEGIAAPKSLSSNERCSLLRAFLKKEGFPAREIEKFLELWQTGDDDKK